MSDKDIRMKELPHYVTPLFITGDLIAIQPYLHYLFIFYATSYNMYSVVQYDLKDKAARRTIDCGYLSTDIYTCIHNQSLYISTTLNKIIPLSQFDLTPQDVVKAPVSYPLFELNSIIPDLMEDKLHVNLEKLKERKESLAVDTTAAAASLQTYYVWIGIGLLLVGLIVVSVMTKSTIANLLILLILVFSFLFILRTYI